MTYHAPLHHEDGQVWTEVAELPGCFALGGSVFDLAASLPEVIRVYLDAPTLALTVEAGDREMVVTAG
jgi:predicted RNase H-like HicB family nuclease